MLRKTALVALFALFTAGAALAGSPPAWNAAAGNPSQPSGDLAWAGPLRVTYDLAGMAAGVGSRAGVFGPVPDPPCTPNRAVQTVAALYEAFAAGDLDTILAIIHPDVVWIESEGIPYGGTFIGRDAVFEGVFAKIAAEWAGFTAEVDEFIKAEGRRVVTLGQDSGTYIATGLSMTAPTASIWTLNNHCQVVRFVQYIDTLAVISAVEP